MTERKDTKCNKRERWELLSKKLLPWEIEAINLRTLGYKYKEVAEKLSVHFKAKKKEKFSDNKLRVLFYKDGRLFEQYVAYAELIAEESVEEARRILESATSTAAMTQVNLMSSGNQGHVRLGASKEILDRALGKATQPVDVKDDRMMQELKDKINSIFKEDEDDASRIAKEIKTGRATTKKGKETS